MKTNCNCKEKDESWTFEKEMGCWYVIRTCEECTYYWEGPDHSKTNRLFKPTSGQIIAYEDNEMDVESIRDRAGKYSIYCFDEQKNYGTPVKFNFTEDIFEFCELNKYSHSELKVINSNDEIVVHVIDSKYVFPKEWVCFNAIRKNSPSSKIIEGLIASFFFVTIL